MKSKILLAAMVSVAVAVSVSQAVQAHVVVTPSAVQTAERVTFSVSVPNEKDVPVTAVRVDVPKNVKSVTPTVKPGWTIETVKEGDVITSISWTGGSIPEGQRDDFTFRAQAPEAEGELRWNAYQDYADGTSVAWDQAAAGDGHGDENSDRGPSSVTKVSNQGDTEEQASEEQSASNSTLPLIFSLLAVILSVFAVIRTRK